MRFALLFNSGRLSTTTMRQCNVQLCNLEATQSIHGRVVLRSMSARIREHCRSLSLSVSLDYQSIVCEDTMARPDSVFRTCTTLRRILMSCPYRLETHRVTSPRSVLVYVTARHLIQRPPQAETPILPCLRQDLGRESLVVIASANRLR
jgi:hypothetical protein